MSISDWSTTAANNATAAPGINWAEGQAPSTVNDSARQMMADVATWRDWVFTTGDVKLTLKTTADSGWVLMNDTTIGDASSGATGRANADTQALFILLWTNTVDADCAVSTGRGATAAGDFAAHKTIALPKALGRALACYGSGSGLTARALAHVLGEETHVLTSAESGTQAHTHSVPAQNVLTSQGFIAGSAGGATAGWSQVLEGGSATANNVAAYTTAGTTTGSSGGASGAAHNNMQPTVFLNVMIKL